MNGPNAHGVEAGRITYRNSATLPSPVGHYSHVCIGAGLVHVSGQLPMDALGRPLSGEPFEVQARQVLDNLDACLRAAGVSRGHLLQVRIYVTDISLWNRFNAIYAEWIGDHRPARAVAGVASLHYGAAIEIEATALAQPD